MDTKRKKFVEVAWPVSYLVSCVETISMVWSGRVRLRWASRGAYLGLVVFGITTWVVATFATTATTGMWVFLGMIALSAWWVGAIIEPWRYRSLVFGVKYFGVTVLQALLLGILTGILWAAGVILLT